MKIVFFFLSACLLVACQPSEPSREDNGGTVSKDQSHAGHTPSLSLNEGAKWKADSSTNNNVKAIQQLSNNFIVTNATEPEHFQQFAAALQPAVDKMIKECRMKGADHDALHQWLEPLLGQVKQLKAAGDTETSRRIVTELQLQLKLYPQYFE